MQINIFEIIAQIINFLVLLFILSKLLYKPVLKTMKERQEKINEELSKADKKMEEASSIISLYENKLREIGDTENELMDIAKKNAVEEKEKLMEGFKAKAEELMEIYYDRIEDEKSQFEFEIRKSLGENSVKIAENILKIFNYDSVHDNMFNVFMGKLASLKNDLNEKYQQEKSPGFDENVVIRSAYEISDENKTMIEAELKRQFNADYKISYITDQRMILGYELRFSSFSLHTNIDRYLEEAQDNLMRIIESKK